MDTENSKINECNKFIYEFIEKLNLKNPIKIFHWLIYVFITHGTT